MVWLFSCRILCMVQLKGNNDGRVDASPRYSQVVAGGGAIEMELSKALRDHSKTIKGKQQLIMSAYAKALEIIPRQLVGRVLG